MLLRWHRQQRVSVGSSLFWVFVSFAVGVIYDREDEWMSSVSHEQRGEQRPVGPGSATKEEQKSPRPKIRHDAFNTANRMHR